MTENKKKILMIFTGGTICSCKKDGKNSSDASKTKSYLADDYEHCGSPYSSEVTFDSRFIVPDVLSENMTVSVWNEILEKFREPNIERDYEGVIVLHGTDTLAYTSSLLSMLLAGFKIPVFMVSAQLALRKENGEKEEESNGYANFRAAVELITNGIEPNVYAIYKNSDGKILLHLGSQLLQCPNHSNDFHSKDEMLIADSENAKHSGLPFETSSLLLSKLKELDPNVLLLVPYPNLPYDRLYINGVSAIVHGTYHSESVCVGRSGVEKDRRYSIATLAKKCRELSIPLFLAPCNRETYNYSSTKQALSSGARTVGNITLEAAYTKSVVGVSLKLNADELESFLNQPINREFAYKTP